MHHIIGVLLGGLTTVALLWLFDAGNRIVSDAMQGYLIAVIAGVIVALAWPWVIGMVLVRRAKGRREDQIQKEVEKQMAEQQRGG